jgi:hypothetical protein
MIANFSENEEKRGDVSNDTSTRFELFAAKFADISLTLVKER